MSEKKKAGIIWGITLGVPLLLLCIPAAGPFTPQIRLYLAITMLANLCFAFNRINQTVVAVLLPVLYITAKICKPAAALAPYTQPTLWMVLGGFMMADVLRETGLLKRVALKCIRLADGSYKGLHWGIAAAGLVLSILIPGKVPIFLAALVYGIIKTMGYTGKEASGLMITAAVSAIVPNTSFIYNPNFFVMVTAGKAATGPLDISWFGYFYYNAVSLLWFIFIVFLSTKMFASKSAPAARDYIEKAYAELGPVTRREKKAAGFVVLMLLALLTQKIHGIAAPWCFVIIPSIMLFPGVGIADPNKIMKNLNYGFIFFMGGCMSIGTAAGALGIGKIVQQTALPLLQGSSTVVVLVFAWVLCMLLNFLMTPMAIYSSMSLPLANIAKSMGINPLAMYFTMYQSTDQIMFAYEYALYMLFFGYNVIRSSDFTKYFTVKMVLNLIFLVAVLIPYWNLTGFLH